MLRSSLREAMKNADEGDETKIHHLGRPSLDNIEAEIQSLKKRIDADSTALRAALIRFAKELKARDIGLETLSEDDLG